MVYRQRFGQWVIWIIQSDHEFTNHESSQKKTLKSSVCSLVSSKVFLNMDLNNYCIETTVGRI